MKIGSLGSAGVLILGMLSLPATAKTALEYLEQSTRPTFREGHTLLPLTRWAWPLNLELNVELAKNWGYAVQIEPGPGPAGAELDRPRSEAARTAAWLQSNGARYPVAVTTRRVMFERDEVTALLSPEAWCRDAAGALILRDGRPVLRPYLSDADAQAVGAAEVARLERLKGLGIEVSVVLNGAEYMPGVPGHDERYWREDPEVNAWLNTLKSGPATEWVDALASNKAKQEQAVRDAVLGIMPQATVVYYTTGDMRRGLVSEAIRLPWAYPYRHLVRGGTIPSWEFYFGYFGAWSPVGKSRESLPLLATNTIAQSVEAGEPLTYNWLSAGWSLPDPARVSDDRRYMGFLKYLYTLGSVGNVAGYFSYPPEGFNDDVGAEAPDWLRQVMILAQVHATFSHLERYLREGDLLPGDGSHPYSVDLYGTASWPHPAYRFVADDGDPAVHVAARKLRDRPEWLIAAWAAEGPDREVAVTIPGLGRVAILARAEGSLFRATAGSTTPHLLDVAGSDPSGSTAEALAGSPIGSSTARPEPPVLKP